MLRHAMPIKYDHKYATLCGIERLPLRFISYVVAWELKNEKQPCRKCFKIVEEMES